jgi:hypothetical protein
MKKQKKFLSDTEIQRQREQLRDMKPDGLNARLVEKLTDDPQNATAMAQTEMLLRGFQANEANTETLSRGRSRWNEKRSERAAAWKQRAEKEAGNRWAGGSETSHYTPEQMTTHLLSVWQVQGWPEKAPARATLTRYLEGVKARVRPKHPRRKT